MKKLNILLDLDNTIISSVSRKEEQPDSSKMDLFEWEDMDGKYLTFARPGLEEFLDFLFANFNVSVWTAASKSYALFIIDNFILTKPDRKLKYIFFSYHCKESKKKESSLKRLKMLWTYFGLNKQFNENNTYIIDDHPQVYKAQPKHCINVKPFEFLDKNSDKDRELKRVQRNLQKLIVMG